jgi:hypothetical protein
MRVQCLVVTAALLAAGAQAFTAPSLLSGCAAAAVLRPDALHAALVR